MSKSFNANFNISGSAEITPGNWEVTGEVIDYSLDGWSVNDVAVGDAFVDESPFFGTNNRWKVSEILTIGPSSYPGATANSIRLMAVWDDIGDPDPNGPSGGISLIGRTSPNQKMLWSGSVGSQLIPETIQNKIHNINAFYNIDPHNFKYVKNDTGSLIEKFKVVAWLDDGGMTKATCLNRALSDIIGVTIEDIPDGSFGWVWKLGYVPGAIAHLNASPGNYVYLSDVPGEMTLTPPNLDNQIKIGKAEPPSGIKSSHATDLHIEFEIIFES